MLVNGGRRRWADLVSLTGWLGALALLVQVGCGSRTSMLDAEAYGDDASGTGGASAAGGSKTTSKGGTASSSAGKGGKGDDKPSGGLLDPKASAVACQQYCRGYAPRCPDRLNGQNCENACAKEVNGFGLTCQSLGIAALQCLAPFFTGLRQEQGCESAVNDGLSKCGDQVAKFEACKPPEAQPQPNPRPMPTMPVPDPMRPPSACGATAFGGGTECYSTYDCPDGQYLVVCTSNQDGTSTCICGIPGGETAPFITSGPTPCNQAAAICGIP